MTTPSWAVKPVRLQAHNAPVHALTFSSGTGQYILTGASDRTIKLFNPASGRQIQSYQAHGYEILDLSVSEDNARFVSVGGDKTVFVWDVATAQTLRRFNGHAGRINACSFGGAEDSVVVTGSFDGTVRIWDTKSRSDKPIMTYSEAKDSVSSITVRDAEIIAGSVDGRVRIYDLRSGETDEDVLGSSVTSVSTSKDGEAYLVSTLDSSLRFMDRPTGKCLQTFRDSTFKNETYRIRSTLAMSDSLAVSGTEDGAVLCWDVMSGKLRYRLSHRKDSGTGHSVTTKKDVVSAVAWNPMRKQLASASGDGEVCVWTMES